MLDRQLLLGIIMAAVGFAGSVFVPEIRHVLLGRSAVSVPSTSWVRVVAAFLVLVFVCGLMIIGAALLVRPIVPLTTTTDGDGTGTSSTADTGRTDTSITVTGSRDSSSPVPPISAPPETMSREGCVFVKVPPGECLVGCTPGDTCTKAEPPGLVQQFGPFWIMQTEVTRRQYARCVADRTCAYEVDGELNAAPDYPVTNIDAIDAQRFCAWIEGRLPKEREWEYAARGGNSTFRYPWGETFMPDAVATGDGPSDVMKRAPNKFGLYDMSGNVAEWTVGPNTPDGRPTAVIRGGSHKSTPQQLRVSYRVVSDYHHVGDTIGFRCVADVPGGDNAPGQ